MENKMIRDEITAELFSMQDKKFGEFQSRLCPTLSADRFIGVRTPELRKYAKKLLKTEPRLYLSRSLNLGDKKPVILLTLKVI